MARTSPKKPKIRSDVSQAAGRAPFSAISMVAGVLAGYAAFSLLLGGAAAILRAQGSQLDLSENWGELSGRGGLLLGALLFGAYLLAGYIAGRMAWRRGAAHGVLVVLGSVLVIGVAAALLSTFTEPDDVEGITDALRSFGVPTTVDEWRNVAAVTWVASVGGMTLGSVLGGLLGELGFRKVSRRTLAAELDLRDREAAASAGKPSKDDLDRRDREAPADAGKLSGAGNLSKDELYQRAQEEDIPGRSSMTKDELAAALKEQGALQQSKK